MRERGIRGPFTFRRISRAIPCFPHFPLFITFFCSIHSSLYAGSSSIRTLGSQVPYATPPPLSLSISYKFNSLIIYDLFQSNYSVLNSFLHEHDEEDFVDAVKTFASAGRIVYGANICEMKCPTRHLNIFSI